MLDRLLRRLPGRPSPAPEPAAPPVSPAAATAEPAQPPAASSVATREQSLAERWLEDESLRGDLDDATFQPIQDWLMAAAHRVAAATAGQDDATAQPVLDQAQAAGRDAARILASALAPDVPATDLARQLEPLHHALKAPLVDPAKAPRVHAALRAAAGEVSRARADPPTIAARLAAALHSGLPAAVEGAAEGQQ